MIVPQLGLDAQYSALREEILEAVGRVLASRRFILGPELEAFEREVEQFTGAAHAIGCASGTDALLLALAALDIGPGDEVITTPFTFIAAAGAIHRLGAKPVFADIDPRTFCLDPQQIPAKINARTRAIVVVHLYGRVAPMGEILDMARSCRIPVIEDAAQAFGAQWRSRRAGTLGTIGCYSFYPTKNLGAAGDAGMVITGDARLAGRIRRLRVHGEDRRYVSGEVGWNSRLDEMQAAILRVKLRRVDAWNEARRRLAARYTELLGGVVRTPDPGPADSHVFHQYVIRTPDRDGMRQRLADRGIGTAVYYPVPLHRQRAFEYLGHKAGDFPEAEAVARDVLALPMYPELSDDAVEYVAGVVRECREVIDVCAQ